MEKFVSTNPFLRRTAASDVFRRSDLQQEVDTFLEAIQEKYGHDAQYQYIMEQTQNEYNEIDEQYKAASSVRPTRFASFLSRIISWLRVYELKMLRNSYEEAQKLVS
jgi:hypothetical protein